MALKRLSVVVTRRLPEPIEARLGELFDVSLNAADVPMRREGLVEAVRRADVLVPTLTDTIDAALLAEAGPRLKLIASYGAGVDHIDVEAAQARGIAVTNTPGAVSEDTADMTMALILAVTRRIPEGLALMHEGRWQGWSPMAMLGGRIAGRKLGILGMGRVGQAVARRARCFGMEVHYHNRHRLHPRIEADHAARYWPSLDQMLSRVDILSVNCPHTPSTYHLVNARRLKLMKPDAVIVNTSRGEVIDENALTRMLRTGGLAGAALDVFENGPDVNPRLQALENVVLLPHMGSATREGRIEMGEHVLINIQTFAEACTRPLSDNETRVAGALFGNTLNTDAVRVTAGVGLWPLPREEPRATAGGPSAPPPGLCERRRSTKRHISWPAAFVLRNTVYFKPSLYTADAFAGLPESAPWPGAVLMAHELVHVWQYQNRARTHYSAITSAGESVEHVDPYWFEIDPKAEFLSYGYEQQGAMVQDFTCYALFDRKNPRLRELAALLRPVLPVDRFLALLRR